MDVGGVMDDSQVSDLGNQVPFAESENSEREQFCQGNGPGTTGLAAFAAPINHVFGGVYYEAVCI